MDSVKRQNYNLYIQYRFLSLNLSILPPEMNLRRFSEASLRLDFTLFRLVFKKTFYNYRDRYCKASAPSLGSTFSNLQTSLIDHIQASFVTTPTTTQHNLNTGKFPRYGFLTPPPLDKIKISSIVWQHLGALGRVPPSSA